MYDWNDNGWPTAAMAPAVADIANAERVRRGLETLGLAPRQGTGSGSGTGGATVPADGGTQIFRFGGVWHARRQILNGRIVMGIGYTQELAVADLEAQWSVA